jgi:serine/threonine-protein kinase
MGTAQYLSPEQAQGHAVSATSDLYAIGVVLYEMLTARVPFDADAAVTIALKHVSESPTAPTQVNPRVPPELEQVVMWALNKNPVDRPRNADDFIRALGQAKAVILAGESGQRTASMAALAGVGAAVGAAAVGAGAAEAAPVAPAPIVDDGAGGNGAAAVAAGPEPPDERHRRNRRLVWIALLVALLLAGGGVAAYLLLKPTKVTVPAVVGDQISVARARLQNAGLRFSVNNENSSQPAGTVIAQDPLGGARANDGSTVQLTVSQGPGNVSVPSVAQLPLGQAKQQITQAGLKVGRVVHEASDQIPSGNVINTDPVAGQSVPVGSAVTIFVSSGKPLATVPDVTGQSEAAAKATLQGAGFSVSSSTQTSSSVQSGNVISQSPAGGTQAPTGSNVSLVIAKAETTATVPSVTGQNQGAATGALAGAGFQVQTQTKNVNNQAQNGIVLSQSPGGGATANKGSTVTIVVGHFQPPPPHTSTSQTTSTTPTTHSSTTKTGP